MYKLFIIIMLAFFSLFSAIAQKRVDSILAKVNGDPITLLDILADTSKQEERLKYAFKGEELEKEVMNIRKKALEKKIESKLIYSEYKSNPFPIPEQYIEDMVDGLSANLSDGSREGLQRKLKSYGVSMGEMREMAKERVAVDIMVNEFCNRTVFITPQKVNEYYKSNPDGFVTPAKIRIGVLVLRKDGKYKDRLKQVMEKIKSGGSDKFSDYVKLYSESEFTGNGGDLGEIEENKLRKDFADAVADLKVGEVSNAVIGNKEIYFIHVIDRKKKEVLSIKNAYKQIRQRLEDEEKKKAYNKYVNKLRAASIIRYYID